MYSQTSQDPSSPLAAVASSNIPSTTPRHPDLRDGWDNDDWGSLEEEPVSGTNGDSDLSINNYYELSQNEEEHEANDDAAEATAIDSRIASNELPEREKAVIPSRPTDLPNLTNTHTSLSPVNSNSAWNSDSWADGEFEPIEEPILGWLTYQYPFIVHVLTSSCISS